MKKVRALHTKISLKHLFDILLKTFHFLGATTTADILKIECWDTLYPLSIAVLSVYYRSQKCQAETTLSRVENFGSQCMGQDNGYTGMQKLAAAVVAHGSK